MSSLRKMSGLSMIYNHLSCVRNDKSYTTRPFMLETEHPLLREILQFNIAYPIYSSITQARFQTSLAFSHGQTFW